MYQVYRIVNLINDKVYIGRSKDAENRFKQHEYTANGGRGYKLHKAIRKYGIHNFKMQILTEHKNLEDAAEKESYFIKVSNSYRNGYNASLGGLGELRSEESYRIMGESYRGKKRTKGQCENISKAIRGRKQKIEHRFNQMKPLNRKQWNKGKEYTEKQKQKMKGMKRRPSHMIQVDNFCTFFSIKYAADYLNVKPNNLTKWFKKNRKNTSGRKLKKIGQILLCEYKPLFLYVSPEEV